MKMSRFGAFLLVIVMIAGCQPVTTNKMGADVYPAHASFMTGRQLTAVVSSPLREHIVPQGRIICGVLPHHLVAGGLMANLMEVLAVQKPQVIILIGPNHHNRGSKIITGFNNWQTPEGTVMTEQKVVKGLLDKGAAVCNEEVLSKEHSVGTLMTLIGHYVPKARVVPIVLHHDVSLEEVDNLLRVLQPFLKKDTVLLASVDFSHYLTRPEAENKDAATLRYMRSFDYKTLFDLGNDYLDSPASLACAFRFAEQHGVKDFRLLANTNSGVIMRNDNMETTSYFILTFTQK